MGLEGTSGSIWSNPLLKQCHLEQVSPGPCLGILNPSTEGRPPASLGSVACTVKMCFLVVRACLLHTSLCLALALSSLHPSSIHLTSICIHMKTI